MRDVIQGAYQLLVRADVESADATSVAGARIAHTHNKGSIIASCGLHELTGHCRQYLVLADTDTAAALARLGLVKIKIQSYVSEVLVWLGNRQIPTA